MSAEYAVEPAFNPAEPARSLDLIADALPLRGTRLAGNIIGDYTSQQLGSGSETDGLREYRLGDNPRYIAWKKSAGMPDGSLLIRQHYRDITPNMWIVTDGLQSRYETNATDNSEYFSEQTLALSAVAGLLQLAQRRNVPVSLIASNDGDIAVDQRRPKTGRRNTLALAQRMASGISTTADRDALLRQAPETVTPRHSFTDLLNYAANRCTRSLVVVVSDFRAGSPNGDNGWLSPLQKLASKRNDLITVELRSPGDEALAEDRTRFLTDTGVVYVPRGKDGQEQRMRYRMAALEQQEGVYRALASVNPQYVELTTVEPRWASSLHQQITSV